MPEIFTKSDGIILVHHVIDIVTQNRDYLSELDGAAGDGDHGVNMAKGMAIANDRLVAADTPDLTFGFLTVSDVLASEIGGSMGPLYGGFFRGVGIASRPHDVIDALAFGDLLREGRARVGRVTEAKVGDKSLIDVLEPALAAYDSALADGRDFDQALTALTEAAAAGVESTRDMVAKIGRSSRLGERSRGHLDAGAASCALILTAMSHAAHQLITKEN